MRAPEDKCEKSSNIGFYCHESSRGEMWKIPLGGYLFRFPREEEKTRTRAVGFLKSPEIPLEGLIKIPLEGNFFRFPRESEKTRTRAVGFLKTPEIPLEGNFFRFPREAEKSRTKAVRFLKSTEIPLEGLIFHPLHVADWPRVVQTYIYISLCIFEAFQRNRSSTCRLMC